MIQNTSLAPAENFVINYIILRLPGSTSLEITNELVSFAFFETINDMIEGSITIQNRANISGLMSRFTGQELIEISFASGKGKGNGNGIRSEYKKTFRCLSTELISDCSSTSPTSYISIELSSQFLAVNETNRISKFYDNTNPSFIVNDILTNYASNFNVKVEETASIGKYSIGVTKPNDVITDLLDVAISTEFKSSDFRFFENRDGLNFVSMGSLMSVKPEFSFAVKTPNESLNAGEGNTLNIEYLDAFWLNNSDNNYKDGTFGCNVTSTSLIDQSFEFIKYDRSTLDKDRPLLNDNSTLYQYENVVDNMQTYNKNKLVSSDSIYNKLKDDHGAHKTAVSTLEKTRNDSKRIVIRSAGFTDITVGDIVGVNFLNIDNGNRVSSNININISGNWIIIAIKYSVTLSNLSCEYTLMSDSNIK